MSETTRESIHEAGEAGAQAEAAGVPSQYLTFVLNGEDYGAEILRVQEIKGWEGVTRVPHTASYILGVMNLRGTVVPVVCLRRRFGLPTVEHGQATVVIVVRVHAGRREKVVGMVVDGVSDVFNVAAGDIQPPPQIGDIARSGFIAGLASSGEKMVMLLDIDRLIGGTLDSGDGASALH